MNTLNVEGRKGLKTLFNISVHSKHYLNTLLNIEHISSSIIITNKLNHLTSPQHKKNRQNYSPNVRKSQLLMFYNRHNITLVFEPIEERVLQELTECLSLWTIQENRTRFTNILE